jgi:hypothetical protein
MSYQCPRCPWIHEVGPADRRLPPWCPKCGSDVTPEEWRPVARPPAPVVEVATAPSLFAEAGEVSVTSTGPKPWLKPRPATAPPVAEAEPGAAPLPGDPAAEPSAGPLLTLLTVAGIGLLVLAGHLAGQVRAFVENGRTTTGEVVAVWKPDPLAFAMFRQHIVIEYRVNGTRYELSAEGRDRGDRVPVVYPPNDPQDGRVKTTGSLYRWPMLVGALGLLPLAFAVVIVCLLPERREPAAEPAASEGSTG